MVSSFKSEQSKIRFFNWYWYVINGRKGLRGGTCHPICQYAKPNNKYMKDYDKNKDSSYLQYWDVNNLYCGAMPKMLPVKKFVWVKDISKFYESFIKT